jgi:hypothetical protein
LAQPAVNDQFDGSRSLTRYRRVTWTFDCPGDCPQGTAATILHWLKAWEMEDSKAVIFGATVVDGKDAITAGIIVKGRDGSQSDRRCVLIDTDVRARVAKIEGLADPDVRVDHISKQEADGQR